MGPLTYGRRHGPVFLGKEFAEERNYSEDAARQIDLEIRGLVDDCYERARRLITEHRDRLELLAETLLERETLTAEEIQIIVKEGVVPPVVVKVPPAPAPEAAEKPVEQPAESKPRAADLSPPLPEAP